MTEATWGSGGPSGRAPVQKPMAARDYPRLLGRSCSAGASAACTDHGAPSAAAAREQAGLGAAWTAGRGSGTPGGGDRRRPKAAPSVRSASASPALAFAGGPPLRGACRSALGRRRRAAHKLFEEVEALGRLQRVPAGLRRGVSPGAPGPADLQRGPGGPRAQCTWATCAPLAAVPAAGVRGRHDFSRRRLITARLRPPAAPALGCSGWGFRLSRADGGCGLAVASIGDAGLLAAWNAGCAHSEKIAVGDRIEQVNGCRTAAPLLRTPPAGATVVVFSRATGVQRPSQDPTDLAFEEVAASFPAPGEDTDAGTAKYKNVEALEACVRSGDVALLRGSWLCAHALDGGTLPRRQDLPEGALWSADDLAAALRRGQRLPRRSSRCARVPIVAVSYCWLARAHPDPHGAWLQLLGMLAFASLEHHRKLLGDRTFDLAVFVDWCSMYQEPMNDSQSVSFKRALKSAAVWFAHPMVEKWLLTKLPKDCDAPHYDERGWPSFERMVASMTTCQDSILDLGLAPYNLAWRSDIFEDSKDGAVNELVCDAATGVRVTWLNISKASQRARVPPVGPEPFGEELAGKAWARRAALPLAQKMYALAYAEVMEGAEELHMQQCRWRAEQVLVLSRALPGFPGLRVLNLQHNLVDDEGAAHLAAVLPACRQLQCLLLAYNRIDDQGAESLAGALPHCPRLSHVVLSQNCVGDPGAGPLAAVLRACPALVHLDISSNCVSERGRRRVAGAWQEAGKPLERRSGWLLSALGLLA